MICARKNARRNSVTRGVLTVQCRPGLAPSSLAQAAVGQEPRPERILKDEAYSPAMPGTGGRGDGMEDSDE